MSPGCCTGIMERVAKINGVIPDRSLVTVDQRALHLDGGEVTFSIAAASGNMSEMMYGAEKSEVGNGGLSSIPSDRRPAVA